MSSGKVNCTCGWSWNKSDSSKKDMYVCHECGRDNSNNMKNGGWLDKHADIPQAQSGTEIDWDKVRSVNDNLGVQAAKMFDPTGITSYPDVYYAAKDLSEGKGSAGNLALSVLGALPMIGKAKTIFHLARASRATDKVKKAKKVLNTVEKIAEKANDFVNYPISKLKPLAESSKVVPKVIGKTAKKVEKLAEKMGKPLSPKGQRISTKQITKSDIKNLGVNLLDTANVTRDVTNVSGQAIDETKQILETPSLIDKNKTIKYYNTDPNRGEVEKPGMLANIQYVPISNSAELSKWKQQGKLKNGGWLDNYNDSQASAPEGMVGDGYSNVGRNYSPAWGGQFQNGGKAPKYVESKNDPRYKAYQDSLSLYKSTPIEVARLQKANQEVLNEMSKRENKTLKAGMVKVGNEPFNKYKNNSYYEGNNRIILGHDSSIKPISFDKYQMRKINSSGVFDKWNEYDLQTDDFGVYKKPQQQVIVQKPKLQAIQNNLQPAGLVQGDFNIEAELPEIRQQIKKPKYYDIEDYTKGSTDYIGNQTNYRTSDLSTLSEQSPNNTRKITPRYQIGGSIYPVNYVPEAQMGGSLPGATGHMYARYEEGGKVPGDVGFSYPRIGEIPSNGPGAKKTMASAQNGKEMQYYQNGLDFKPKTISRDGSIIKDDRGQWDHPGEITEIGSNEITMKGVPYNVLGVSDTGDTKLMKPGKNYKFKGKKVTEYPMAKNGLRQEQKGLQNLDNLLNFTNYNKPQPGSWLEKYN